MSELQGDDAVRRLIEIGESLTSAGPLEDRVVNALRKTTELLGCDRCSIMLWDGLRYRAAYNWGNPPEVAADFMKYTVPEHAPLVTEANRTRRFVVVNHAKSHEGMSSIAKHANIESIVLAPMYDIGGARLGFMTAEFNEHVGEFDTIRAEAAAGIASLLQSTLTSARDRRERRAAEQDRQQMIESLAQAEQRERRRISADIHDDVLQRVTSIGHFLEIMADEVVEPAAHAQLKRLEHEARDAALTLRRLVEDLHPSAVELGTLRSALTGLTSRTSELTGVEVSLLVNGSGEPTLGQAGAIYRIAQQALDNAVVHGKASFIEVTVGLEADGVRLKVSDDGIGFVRSSVPPGRLGLFSMTHRAQRIGGSCTIDSALGAGTEVTAFVPRPHEHSTERGVISQFVAAPSQNALDESGPDRSSRNRAV